MVTHTIGHLDSEIDTHACIDACLTAHRLCLGTAATHGLGMGGQHASPRHMNLLLDCAAMCQSTADFAIRRSEMTGFVAGLCSHICKICGDECDEFADDSMRECAKACHHCARECLNLSKIAAGHLEELHK